MPLVLRDGLADLGGIGWGRGLVMSVLSGPPQAMIAYSGFMLVPLGHGTTIQPACAALFGLILATLVLGERPTVQRIFGGVTIIAGLMVFGAESLTTIGSHGVGGDLLFATAGLFWATFGTLLRLLARVGHARGRGGRRAVDRRLCAAAWLFVGYRRHAAHESCRKPAAGRRARRARRRAADLSVRARGDPARRRARGDVSGAGAGLRADHRLSRARRRAEPRRSSSAW